MSTPRRTCASLIATTALLASAPTVRAEVFRDEPFTESYVFDYSDCGFPIHVEGEVTVAASLRMVKNADVPIELSREVVSAREVHTNPANGKWFVVSGHGTFREINATNVDGNVYEITQVLAGQPTVIADSSGQVIARDRGSIRFRLLFDTGDDTDPERQFAGVSGVSVNGPHDTDFCATAGALAGVSHSSERYSLRPLGTTASPMGYGEYLPPDYDQAALSPLLVFLHGAGEGGDGSADQLQALARAAIPGYIANDAWPDDRPFVVLAPQHVVSGDLSPYSMCAGVAFGASCAVTVQHDLGNPTPGSVCPTPHEIHDFIDYAVATYAVDPDRVYLTGLSCGGYGVWEYLSQHLGEQVAAAVPVSGEGRPAWHTAGCALGAVPLWAFHGGADQVVDPAGSIEPITELQACGSPTALDARLAVVPGAHDATTWAQAYAVGAEHDIYTWMLGYARS